MTGLGETNVPAKRNQIVPSILVCFTLQGFRVLISFLTLKSKSQLALFVEYLVT